MSRTSHTAVLVLVLCLLSGRAAQAQITWSPPQPLAPDTAAFVRQRRHSVAARDTALWTLWYEDRNTGQYLIKASRFSESAGAWLEPESVASDTQNHFAETVVDADLRPWAVWNNYQLISLDSALGFLYWSRRQDDSWTSPGLITTDTIGASSPSICADPEQGIWAIWVAGVAESISTLSSYCRTDSWTPPSVIDEDIRWFVPYTPLITVPPGGKVRAVWLAGLVLNSAVWTGDSWTEYDYIPGSSAGYYHSVCSDSAGGTWVMWYDGFSGETIHCARHDGTGWTDNWILATGRVSCFRGMLCCDAQGRVWAMWEDYPGGIYVRYFDGVGWSERSVVSSGSDRIGRPRIAADQDRVWVVWVQWESDDRWLLYYSHTQGPGVAGHEPQGSYTVRVSPSVVRAGTAIRLTGLQSGHTVRLLDAAGRSVELPPEKSGTGSRVLDLSTAGLSPGVYFVRVTGHGRPVSYKVLVVRGK